MTSSRAIALGAVMLAFAGVTTAQKTPTAKELIEQAHKATDLSRLGPYVLTAELIANPGTKAEQKGTIGVHRDGERARVDVQVGDRTETRITIGSKDYLDPNKTLFSGTWLNEFDRLWDSERPMKNVGNGKLKSVSVAKQKINGHETFCIESKYESGNRKLCMDAQKSVPVTFGAAEFSDYAAAPTGALFPQNIRINEQFGVPVEIRNIRISPFPVEARLFELPEHAMEFVTCDDASPLKMTETPTPVRSNYSRHAVTSNIIVYAFIDQEGKVAAAKFITRVPAELEGKAAAAVRQWRFQPEVCAGKPVNFPVTLALDWTLF